MVTMVSVHRTFSLGRLCPFLFGRNLQRKKQNEHLEHPLNAGQIFSVLFPDDAFLPKPAVAGGNPYYFLVRNSVLWPNFALLLARVGFAVFRPRKPVLVRSSVLSAHGTSGITGPNA